MLFGFIAASKRMSDWLSATRRQSLLPGSCPEQSSEVVADLELATGLIEFHQHGRSLKLIPLIDHVRIFHDQSAG